MKKISEHIFLALLSGILGLLIYIALCETVQSNKIEEISSDIQSINDTLNELEIIE